MTFRTKFLMATALFALSGPAIAQGQNPFLPPEDNARPIDPNHLGLVIVPDQLTLLREINIPAESGTITLSNPMARPMTIESIVLSGSVRGEVRHNCLVIPARGACPVTITPTNTTLGSHEGQLVVVNGERSAVTAVPIRLDVREPRSPTTGRVGFNEDEFFMVVPTELKFDVDATDRAMSDLIEQTAILLNGSLSPLTVDSVFVAGDPSITVEAESCIDIQSTDACRISVKVDPVMARDDNVSSIIINTSLSSQPIVMPVTIELSEDARTGSTSSSRVTGNPAPGSVLVGDPADEETPRIAVDDEPSEVEVTVSHPMPRIVGSIGSDILVEHGGSTHVYAADDRIPSGGKIYAIVVNEMGMASLEEVSE